MAFIYSFTDLWNAGGTTFDAIKVDVTDTASAAASLLLNLSVGGSVKASVRKDGHILGASLALGGATIGTNALAVTGTGTFSSTVVFAGGFVRATSGGGLQLGWTSVGDIGVDFVNSNNFLMFASGAAVGGRGIGFVGTASASATPDATISRNAAGVIQFGTTTVNAAGSWLATNGTLSGTLLVSGRITTLGGAAFLATNTALTDGAAAQAGTLLTAPIAGNPTKWIGINDNGTTRYIPAW